MLPMTRATVVQNPMVCLEEGGVRRRTIPYSAVPPGRPLTGPLDLVSLYWAVFGAAAAALASYSRWVRRMLHHSLCSAIGMPHSTHTRTRCRGSEFRENSFCHKDIVASRTRLDAGSQGSRPMLNLRIRLAICSREPPQVLEIAHRDVVSLLRRPGRANGWLRFKNTRITSAVL